MALRNRNPSEPRRADKPIRKVVSRFLGMITGEPANKQPAEYARLNYNIVDHGDYFKVRSGSKLYTTLKYGIDFIPDGFGRINIPSTETWPWDDGDSVMFAGDDLPPALNETTVYYVRSWIAGSVRTIAIHLTRQSSLQPGGEVNVTGVKTGKITFGRIFAKCDHIKAQKLILLCGNSIYIFNKTMTTFTRAYEIGDVFEGINYNSIASIIPFGDNAILSSKQAGMYLIVIDTDFSYMVKMNAESPNILIDNVVENVGIGVIYGYLYTQAFARITGSGNRDRATDGAVLQLETGTCMVNNPERDYAEIYFNSQIGVDLTVNHIIGDQNNYGNDGCICFLVGDDIYGKTHISFYRSKQIGENSGGLNFNQGKINRRDQLVWLSDVPLCKSWIFDTSTTAGSAKLIGTGTNKFERADIGSRVIVVDQTGATDVARISGYTDENTVTLENYPGHSYPVSATCWACIGGYMVGKATQSVDVDGNNIVVYDGTVKNGVIFSYQDVGKIIFVSDGSIRHIIGIGYASSKYYAIVGESGNFTGLAVATQARGSANTVAYNRAFNDMIPDKPQPDGRVSLQDRIDYGSDLYVPRRFFRPIPDCDIAYVDSGFLVCTERDTAKYYYCQTGDKPYTIGQYKFPEQERDVVGSIRHITGMPFRAIFLFRNKTGILTLNSSQNIGRTEIGENIFQLPELSIVDDERGVIAWKLLTYKNNNLLFAFTNEGSLRYFDGQAWSKEDFGFVNGLDAVSKEYLKRIDQSVTYGANYNANGGLKLWMQRMVDAVREDVCLRFATEINEGYGWSVYGGTDWVFPIDDLGIITLLDDNGVQRVIAIDRNDYRIYEIDTFDRVTDERPFALDKVDVEDTEISWYRRLREEVADLASEHHRMKHERSYVYVQPEYPDNRGKTGYTATGHRNAQEMTLRAYLDGEQVTARAETTDFPEGGELVFSGTKVAANRTMIELAGTAAESLITTMVNEFTIEQRVSDRAKRTMTEHDIQKELAQDKVLHCCRDFDGIKNRATGMALSGSITTITGPDGRDNSAYRITGTVVCDNAAITGVYTIIMWSKDTNFFTGITGFTAYGAVSGSWQMYYKNGTGLAADLVLLAGDKSDIRIYSKTVSAAALALMRSNTVDNAGEMLLPGIQ